MQKQWKHIVYKPNVSDFTPSKAKVNKCILRCVLKVERPGSLHREVMQDVSPHLIFIYNL